MLSTIVAVLVGSLLFAAPVLLAYQSRRPAPPTPSPDEPWRAVVRTAQAYEVDRYTYGFSRTEATDLHGEVSVRVVRGKQFLTVGMVKTDADDFDDQLHAMVAKAEDRAATLNAVRDMIEA